MSHIEVETLQSTVCLKMQEINNNGTTDIPHGGMLANQSPEPAQAWVENEKPEKKPLLHSTLFEISSRVRSRLTVTRNTQSTLFRQTSNYAKPPYVTIGLSIISAIVYFALPEDAYTLLNWSPGPRWQQPWKVIAYGLIRAVVTLAGGCILLEIEQGWWRVLLVWSGGLVAAFGALGAGILQPTVYMVSHSAGIWALLTAHIPNISLKIGSIPCWWIRIILVVVFPVVQVCLPLWPELSLDVNSDVWSAHLTGAMVGVPLGFLIFKGTEDNKYKLRNIFFQIISAAALLEAVVCVIIYYNFYADSTTIYTAKI